MMVENYQKYMQQIQNVYIFGGRKKKTIHFLSTLSEVHSDFAAFYQCIISWCFNIFCPTKQSAVVAEIFAKC